MQRKIIITCGDVNGIGPEIAIKAIAENFNPIENKFVLLIPKNVFEFYYSSLVAEFEYSFARMDSLNDSNVVDIVDIGEVPMNIGQATSYSGKAAFDAINKALEICKNDLKNSILVTAPISKTAFEMAGVKFPGHTELLADYFDVKKFAMIFLGKEFNAALLTIHIPIAEVPENIKGKRLEDFLRFVKQVIEKDLGIQEPKIAVLGLNPHAGENGRIGKEELNVISPVLKKLGYAEGPFVPDAFFGMKKYRQYDIVVGMYHDQVLIPFKLLEMNKGVNFTAGLPIVRTSPDHGTAFDIAGKMIADPGSMSEAIKQGIKILENRRNK